MCSSDLPASGLEVTEVVTSPSFVGCPLPVDWLQPRSIRLATSRTDKNCLFIFDRRVKFLFDLRCKDKLILFKSHKYH